MRFRVGSTFDYSGKATVQLNGVFVKNFTDWTATSQIRDLQGELIATLAVTWLNAYQGHMRVRFVGSTLNWPLGNAIMDIVFTDSAGNVAATEPAVIQIYRGATYD